ncbi:DUF3048 domain-containing protein [Candidatus Saccharibacteria bacterium]|nr:DUF3048 domain-containing protein [Candidatus Saccharibacteria bacterium]
MDNQELENEIVITDKEVMVEEKKNKEVKKPEKAEKGEKKGRLKRFFSKKRNVVITILVVLILATGGVLAFLLLNKNNNNGEGQEQSGGTSVKPNVKKFYDNLTGELVSYSGIQYNKDGSEKKDEDGKTIFYSDNQAEQYADANNTKRISCVQIPNGTDARPQVGLTDAKIVFEAIAEAGITRFAAIYRDSKADVIGPVRSLRMYYLEWDDPFDCTIVHAGGETNALNKVKTYPHLSESKTYMWRDSSAYRAPNNLFTSGELLGKFNSDNNYDKSRPAVFSRMTPDESDEEIKAIRAQTEKKEGETENNSESEANENAKKYTLANKIYVHVTNAANYNVIYNYDSASNTYLRSYEGNSGKHMVYDCKNLTASGAKIKPQKDCGAAVQVAPKVVVVMKVKEQQNQINHYREDLETTGSGEAYIFQNGIKIEGTWAKDKINSQIVFKDKNGEVIKLAPGQTFITAIAKSYGYVKAE